MDDIRSQNTQQWQQKVYPQEPLLLYPVLQPTRQQQFQSTQPPVHMIPQATQLQPFAVPFQQPQPSAPPLEFLRESHLPLPLFLDKATDFQPSKTQPQQVPAQPVIQQTNGIMLHIDIGVVNSAPHPSPGERVASHVLVYRGKYWHSTKAELSWDPDYQMLMASIKLTWKRRPLHVLEAEDMISEQAKNTVPSRIFLEFHSINNERSEFRFGTSFDVRDLLSKGYIGHQRRLDLVGRNNNMLMGNKTLQYNNTPEKYEIIVNLAAPSLPLSIEALQAVDPATLWTPNEQPLVLHRETLIHRSTTVGNWFRTILQPYMTHQTPFQNLRTFIRNDAFSPLFTNLPELWTSNMSAFPIEVLLYLTLNALIINGQTQTHIRSSFPFLSSLNTNTLLRICRDVIMGFTMCKTEGKYQSDTLFGVDSDDQPFVDGSNFDSTFFSRDDCEGRLQQGQMIVNMLTAIARWSFESIWNHVRTRQMRLINALGDEILEGIIKCTMAVSWLFSNKIMKFSMCVGEARFGKLEDANSAMHTPPKFTGHSFGALTFKPGILATTHLPWMKQLPHGFTDGMQIVEATGWMNEFDTSEIQSIYKSYKYFMRQHLQVCEETPSLRSCTTIAQCDTMYCFIYTIDDKIVFGYNQALNQYVYGASPSQFITGQVKTFTPKHLVEAIQNVSEMQQRNLPIDTFFAPLFNNLQHSPALAPNEINIINNNVELINQHCRYWAEYIQPPPDMPDELDKRMDAWHPITDEHIKTTPANQTVALVVRDPDADMPYPVGWKPHAHPFMLSHIFLMRPPSSINRPQNKQHNVFFSQQMS